MQKTTAWRALLAALALTTLVLVPALAADSTQTPVQPLPLHGRTIVLDAGHGGAETGAIRPGIEEKDLTLEITLKLKKALEDQGATVVMTRSGDDFVSLEQRVEISNKTKPDAFVSVHINCTRQKKTNISGVEVWYRTPQSRQLAFDVDGAVITTLGVDNRGVKVDDLYVVHHTDAESVLVEVGFINNPAELKKMRTAQYQESISKGIVLGLTNHWSQRSNASSPTPAAKPHPRKRHTSKAARARAH